MHRKLRSQTCVITFARLISLTDDATYSEYRELVFIHSRTLLKTKTSKASALAAVSLSAVLALSACGASNSSSDDSTGSAAGGSSKWANCTPAQDAKDVTNEKPAKGEKTDLTLAASNGWDETIATAYLAKNILKDYGYSAKVKMFDLAPGYVATANGNVDWLSSTMLPKTHAPYIKKYGNKVESQGCWYDDARNTIAVDKDSPAKTIDDLKKYADDYDGKIYGIEKGSGLMDMTQKQVMPDYGLKGKLQLLSSSTPAMLSAVKKAEAQKKHIAVTLWHPHWAYAKFNVRDLKDTKKAFGDPDYLYTISRKGFTKDHALPSQILKNLALKPDVLQDLERVMADKYDGKHPDKAVAEWTKDNPDFKKNWKAGKLTTKGENKG